ncbi:hypothetical protein HBH43_245610 [Parastagonospora nodorum]|nr:hypothetical protein HBH43_245610 [Parastagonospora nodorum]
MRPISINNDLLRHEQQQRPPILRRFSKTNDTCYKVQRLTVAYRRKMRCNYNPKTRLQNNNRYAEAVVYSARQSNTVNNAPQLSTILVATTEYKDISSLNYTQFIRTLEREVGFEDKRSGIYYYTKTADTRWHGALQDTVATKLYRATFVIELLI